MHSYLAFLMVAIVFVATAAAPAPHVNEVHYLTKAKSFWDPAWCAGDLFLESADVHWLFYASIGWSTRWISLDAAVWVWRLAAWMLLAAAWCSLCGALGLKHWRTVIAALAFAAVQPWVQMAGEWVLGGVEAKVFAWALAWWAIAAWLRKRWMLTCVLLGLSTAWHPLVGGWLLVCLLAAQWSVVLRPRAGLRNEHRSPWHRRAWIRRAAGHFAGASLVVLLGLPGLLPAMLAGWNADASVRAEANQIYVYQRLSHHLLFSSFDGVRVLSFALAGIGWFVLGHRQQNHRLARLQRVVAASLLLTALGIALSLAAAQPLWQAAAASLLRFYWFRTADVLLPLALALMLASRMGSSTGAGNQAVNRGRHPTWVLISATLIAVWVGLAAANWRDPRPPADRQSLPSYADDWRRTWETYRNWRRVTQWVSENTPQDAVFVTPRQQQTFRWYAQRAEVVNWKDIPQDSQGLVEWDRRMHAIHWPGDARFGVLTRTDEQLRQIMRQSGARYLVVPQVLVDARAAEGWPVQLRQVYPVQPGARLTFVVFATD